MNAGAPDRPSPQLIQPPPLPRLDSIVGHGEIKPQVGVHLQELAPVRLRAPAGCRINRAPDPLAARLDRRGMDRRLRFADVVLRVKVKHVRVPIQRTPHGCRAIPSDVEPVGPRPVRRSNDVPAFRPQSLSLLGLQRSGWWHISLHGKVV